MTFPDTFMLGTKRAAFCRGSVLPLLAAGYPGDKHSQIRSSPILVDVDSDNCPEIVIGVGWQIHAINGDGSIVPDFMYGSTP